MNQDNYTCIHYLSLNSSNTEQLVILAEKIVFKKSAISKEEQEQGKEGSIEGFFKYTLPAPDSVASDSQEEWQLNNWGVINDAFDIEEEAPPRMLGEDEMEYSIRFKTHGTTAITGLTILSKEFPDIRFTIEYESREGGFSGITIIKGGVVTLNKEFPDAFYGEGDECMGCGYQFHHTALEDGYCSHCI